MRHSGKTVFGENGFRKNVDWTEKKPKSQLIIRLFYNHIIDYKTLGSN